MLNDYCCLSLVRPAENLCPQFFEPRNLNMSQWISAEGMVGPNHGRVRPLLPQSIQYATPNTSHKKVLRFDVTTRILPSAPGQARRACDG